MLEGFGTDQGLQILVCYHLRSDSIKDIREKCTSSSDWSHMGMSLVGS